MNLLSRLLPGSRAAGRFACCHDSIDRALRDKRWPKRCHTSTPQIGCRPLNRSGPTSGTYRRGPVTPQLQVVPLSAQTGANPSYEPRNPFAVLLRKGPSRERTDYF